VSEESLSRDEQLAVAEIQLCQDHVTTSSQRVWQSGGIILAGAMATLALMLQISESDFAAAVITTLFAAGAIAVLWIWLQLIQREHELQHASIERMREIESALGFERQKSNHGA
jgi:hypothetical protein